MSVRGDGKCRGGGKKKEWYEMDRVSILSNTIKCLLTLPNTFNKIIGMILISIFLIFLQDSDNELSDDEDEEMERNWKRAQMVVSISQTPSNNFEHS